MPEKNRAALFFFTSQDSKHVQTKTNANGYHLLIILYVPGAVMNASHVWSHFIFTMSLEVETMNISSSEIRKQAQRG